MITANNKEEYSEIQRNIILSKFQISALNTMQEKSIETIETNKDVVLLSPTGTGKTLVFLLPLIEKLNKNCKEIQILILVPSRELAQQIEQVARKMGSGFKVNSVYGGRSGSQDKIDLKHRPAILIGTPGRVADRLRRDHFSLESIKTLVIDEYDKSLEIGFENEISEIINTLPSVKQRVLTSATSYAKIPDFLGLTNPVFINHIKEIPSKLKVKVITSEEKDKLKALSKSITYIGNQPGIIFCNFKDALERISIFLNNNNISHLCFHGGMEQVDRERTLIKFRNKTNQLLLATDLAARGLDIPEIKFILHYHLPIHNKEFTHRNGRTARMNQDGVAYILKWKEDQLPDFIKNSSPEIINIDKQSKDVLYYKSKWETLYISGGRRDKISKGDVAGLLIKKGEIKKDQIGVIEIKQNCSYVAVDSKISESLIIKTNNSKLKKKKIRITLL
jgi:superfamily II DNA/RNA helicase